MSAQADALDLLPEAPCWPLWPLGDLVEVLDKKRKPITKRNRVAGPYPYYGATGVLDWVDGYLFDERLVLIGEDGAKWNAGADSAFAITGKTWVNNHAHVLRPNRERLIDDWLIYYLNATDLSRFISGMTVPKLNQGQLREIPVPVPPLEEQKRIVAVLDQAFAALDRAHALMEANLAHAESLFMEALRRRVAVKVETDGSIKLEQLSEHITDGDHQAPPKVDTGVPFITISNIEKSSRSVDFSKTFYVPRSYYDKLNSKRRPKYGDILYSVTGSFGIPVLVKDYPEFCFQRHIGLVRPNESTNSDWLYFMLMSPQCFEQADSAATGTAQRTVSLKALRALQIPDTPPQEQSQIASEISELYRVCFERVAQYKLKLRDLEELRRSVLNRAFSGQLS